MKFLVLALCVCAANAGVFVPTYNRAVQLNRFGPGPTVSAQAYAEVGEPAVSSVARTAAVYGSVPVQKAYKVPQPSVPVAPVFKSSPVPVAVPVSRATVYAGPEASAAIVRSESEISPNGYRYVYQTSNDITAEATGVLKSVGNTEAVVSQGRYVYVAPDNTPVEIEYIADENGYQPKGNVIPVAPPVPEAIARSLAYIAARSASPVITKQY